MVGTLSLSEIENLLQSSTVARLACCVNDRPYIVPINYAFSNNSLYGRTVSGKKLDMMRQNPVVCIEVEDIQSPGNWKTVIAWGKFEELTEAAERESALKLLHEQSVLYSAGINFRFTDEWPFKPDDMNSIEGVVYKIVLDEKSGRFERS